MWTCAYTCTGGEWSWSWGGLEVKWIWCKVWITISITNSIVKLDEGGTVRRWNWANWAKLALSESGIGPNRAKLARSKAGIGRNWAKLPLSEGGLGPKWAKCMPEWSFCVPCAANTDVKLITPSLEAWILRKNGSANRVYDIYIYIYIYYYFNIYVYYNRDISLL